MYVPSAVPHSVVAYFSLPSPGALPAEEGGVAQAADGGWGAGPGDMATPLAAHVGGACSIVHVLEWKEGMAILPSSSLKVTLYVNL